MEDKNFGFVCCRNHSKEVLVINSTTISSFKLNNSSSSTYLVINSDKVEHFIPIKDNSEKELMFKLSVFMLNPSEFDYMFFLNITSKEIFGVDLEKE